MIGLYRRPWPRAQSIGVAHQSPGAPAPPNPPFTYDYFVSPSGGSGAGSFESPWSLDYALAGAGGLVTPALSGPLSIGLRGGDYGASTFRQFTIPGEKRGGVDDPDGKIIWRNYNGEDVQPFCDSSGVGVETFRLRTSYNWVWGINAWRKKLDRYNYGGPGSPWWIQGAVNAGQAVNGNKLIHCWGREGSNGVFIDSDTGNTELYGCTFIHSGVSNNPSAHGFYAHHKRDSGETGSRLSLTDIISFDHLGNCGQIYASGAPEQLDDIDVLWLIAWGGGRLNGLSNPHTNLTFGGSDASNIPMRDLTAKFIISRHHVGFGRANLRFHDGGNATGESAVLEDSYLVGGTPGSGNGRLAIGVIDWASFAARRNAMMNLEQTVLINTDASTFPNYVWEDNAFYGSDPTSTRWRSGPGFTDRTWAAWKTFTGLGNASGHEDTAQTTLPTATKVFVRPVNKYEYGRGHVVVFNWGNLPRIPVDLSSILAVGDRLVVRNVQQSSPERSPELTVLVYDAPTGGNIVTTWLGSPVYFPSDGVTPPPLYGFNNAALDAVVYPAGANYAKTATLSPGFDVFIVSTS